MDLDCSGYEAGPSATSEATITRKRTKKYTSPVWNYFEKCDSEPGFASCLLCGMKYQHSNNTSNLSKVTEHLTVKLMH